MLYTLNRQFYFFVQCIIRMFFVLIKFLSKKKNNYVSYIYFAVVSLAYRLALKL